MKLMDKTIYVCSYSTKEKLLKNNNELLDIKFIDKKTFINNILYTYDEKAICYVMDKYNYSYDNAKIMLHNMQYIIFINSDLNNEKTKIINTIYTSLVKENLLIKNELFIKLNENYKVVVVGYDYIDTTFKYCLEHYKNYEIYSDQIKKYEKEVYVHNSFNDEVEFAFEKISSLINQGVSLNSIKLVISNNNYMYYINKFSLLYNIKLPVKIMLNTTKESNKFLELLKENNSFEDCINYLTKEGYDKTVINKIIEVCNKYSWYEGSYDLLQQNFNQLFKETTLLNCQYDNQLEVINLTDYVIGDDEYIFVLGFCEGAYPTLKKNDDYLNDVEKEALNIIPSYEINSQINKNFYQKLITSKNISLSYSTMYKKQEFYEHNYLNTDDFNQIKPNKHSVRYSKGANILKLASLYDTYYKYNTITDEFICLKNNLNILYKIYENKFSGLSDNQIDNFKNKSMAFSYSSLDTYYKCAFAYYLKKVLKVETYETSFAATVGSIYHEVLMNYLEKDFDVENEINKVLENYEFTTSEKLFLVKILDILKETVGILKEQDKKIGFSDISCEFKYEIQIDDLTKFIGIIDKVYTDENNPCNKVIVDYKTGVTKMNPKNLKFGLDMQLFMYMYLLSKANNDENINILGVYLQYLLQFNEKYDAKKTQQQQNIESLYLNGYSTDNIDELLSFDETALNSTLIKGIKTKTDGQFYSNSKVMSNDDINSYMTTIDNNIKQANSNIRNGEFTINPKVLDNVNVSCTFCKFKDICFYKYQDIVKLNSKEEEDELY